jgi:ADP-dependent NAD(P)H-hydrate dehydratase / NAD(P)H-hydrate epimerase
VVADVTLTFLAHKPGLYTGPAVDCVGEVVMLGLDVPGPTAATVATGIEFADVRSALPWRVRSAHKGSSGTLIVVGGATGMVGAAILAARAGLRAGAGKVKVGFVAEQAPIADMMFPELMYDTPEALKSPASAVVLGPGMSTSPRAKEALTKALSLNVPLVLDADALNLVHMDFGLRDRLRTRTAPTIATPHPQEAARLLSISTEAVNADRITAARRVSETLRAHVALKGAGTVCVNVTGATTINRTGNPLLATAGTGDVLAGMIGALLAQGLKPFHAMVIGVAWHGHIADTLAARGIERATASDIVEQLAFVK